MKLTSMTDFVLEQYGKRNAYSNSDNAVLFKIKEYANFLKQPLKLEMFVPCDDEGNVLEEPYNDGINDLYYLHAFEEYQQAKEKVLFEVSIEDLEEISEYWVNNAFYNATIEEFITWNFNVQLTESAIKQIGL